MIAKNVGIRRAYGQFILATNVDILFSDELIRFLASGRLRPRILYRIDRYDVPSDVPARATIEDQLDYCMRNIVCVNGRDCTFERDDLRWKQLGRFYCGVKLLKKCQLLFSSASSQKGFAANARTIHTLLVNGADYIRDLISPSFPKLHGNACGDFTLMAREHWYTLRGYPELEMFSYNLDFVLCHMAYHIGVQEKILQDPMRIYHIGHSSGWTPKGDAQMKERLRIIGVPMVDTPQFKSLAMQMQREKRPIILNSEGWGLASEHLLETTIN